MPKLYRGTQQIFKLQRGGREIQQLWLGDHLIYTPGALFPLEITEMIREIGFETEENIFNPNLNITEMCREIGFETT